jgi:hypothetical protein
VPLNATAVAPVNAEPDTVSDVPTWPLDGLKPDTVGGGGGGGGDVTVNELPLRSTPPGVATVIGPVETLPGTVAVIRESPLTVNVAWTPLNATAVAPVNAEPLIVTLVPTAPLDGLKPLRFGGRVTMKETPLRAVPWNVLTVICPLDAWGGTVVSISLSFATVNLALAPLNITAIAPLRRVPLITTDVPPEPLVGLKEEMEGPDAYVGSIERAPAVAASAISTPATTTPIEVLPPVLPRAVRIHSMSRHERPGPMSLDRR